MCAIVLEGRKKAISLLYSKKIDSVKKMHRPYCFRVGVFLLDFQCFTCFMSFAQFSTPICSTSAS